MTKDQAILLIDTMLAKQYEEASHAEMLLISGVKQRVPHTQESLNNLAYFYAKIAALEELRRDFRENLE